MKIEESKNIYDKIQIPGELEQVVDKTINDYRKATIKPRKDRKGITVMKAMKYISAAAAIVVLSMTALLNSNEAFAKEMSNMPLIGGLAKVLTIRSYEKVEDNANISVQVPAVEVNVDQKEEANTDDAENNKNFVMDINVEIDKIVNDYTKEAEKRIADYKDAFIATGGTEEEWAQKDIKVTVDYEIKYQKDNQLSLILNTNENLFGAYDVKYYYNLDLLDNKKLTLKDVLGDNYKEVTNESIISQMKDRVKENSNYVYWGITDDSTNMGGFTTVDENTSFYINKAGNPVICFDKYTIAPGFMGIQEFEITK
jgi:hypothetical protein